jgi:excinuclease ABC subunit B
MGRAARNINGRVVLYADRMTDSMKAAIAETERRRSIQAEFNALHGIVPRSATRSEQVALGESQPEESPAVAIAEAIQPLPKDPREQQRLIEQLKKSMFDAAARREYEEAAEIRDRIKAIQAELLIV